MLKTTYVLPLSVSALVVALIGLGLRARQRDEWGPLVVGIGSSVLLMVGRFAFVSDAMTYCGGGLLIAASVWNSWPRKRTRSVVELQFPCDSIPQPKENKTMTTQRKVEVFSAGCSVCDDAVNRVQSIACASCEVDVLDMNDPHVARRAKSLGVQRVPAVVIDGKLADCCTGSRPDEATLRAAGLGQTT